MRGFVISRSDYLDDFELCRRASALFPDVAALHPGLALCVGKQGHPGIALSADNLRICRETLEEHP